MHLKPTFSFSFHHGCHRRSSPSSQRFLSNDDWSTFAALEEDEEKAVDMSSYAKEEDSQEHKADVGSLRPAPTVDHPAEPISVPAGKHIHCLISAFIELYI
jgi:hypothetical protein